MALIGCGCNILQAGGNWNNEDQAGLCYLNSNNDASKSNQNIGSRLELRMLFREKVFYEQRSCPHRLVKHTTTNTPRQASMLRQYKTSGENASPCWRKQ